MVDTKATLDGRCWQRELSRRGATEMDRLAAWIEGYAGYTMAYHAAEGTTCIVMRSATITAGDLILDHQLIVKGNPKKPTRVVPDGWTLMIKPVHDDPPFWVQPELRMPGPKKETP